MNVQDMYSDHAPFPNRFEKLLNEQNPIKKLMYTILARGKIYNSFEGYKYVYQAFGDFLPSDKHKKLRILDAGCGTGEKALRFSFAFPNSEIIGLDFSKSSIINANKLSKHFKKKNIKFYQHDLRGNLEDYGKFDFIHCAGVLHHIPNPVKVLENLKEVMKENSYLYIFLYSDKSIKHKESSIRYGLAKLFPNEFRKKIEFLNKFEITRYAKKSFLSKLIGLRNFFFNDYIQVPNQQHLFDGYAHPFVEYYNSKKIKNIIETSKFKVAKFITNPYNKFMFKEISKIIPDKDIYDKMEILESIIYPVYYDIILKK